jgi:hypothetical protein
MKLSEITESFDSKIRGRLIQSTPNLFIVRATIGDRDIDFTASRMSLSLDVESETDNAWEIMFYERKDGDISTRKSGSGNEMQVFAFILDAINELITRYSPDEMLFSATKTEQSRIGLYNKMIKRIKIPGYTGQMTHSDKSANQYSIIKDKLH